MTPADTANENRPASGSTRRERIGLAIAITVIFGIVIIRQSLTSGLLAMPSTYDDISYFVEGGRLLLQFYDVGFRALVQHFIIYPPHAPLSSALTFLGYAIFGIKEWAAPAMNILVLALFSVAFMEVARPLPKGQGALLLLALLGAPFASLTVLWFRPDQATSLMIAVGMLYIILRPTWLTTTREQIIAGLLLAAALWSKPAIFHLSLALFGVAMLLATSHELLERRLRAALRPILLTVGTGIVLSLPYFASGIGPIVKYIWNTVFGAQSDIWVQSIPLRDHIRFYLTGHYGRISLGQWVYAGSILIAVASGIVLIGRDRSEKRRLLLALLALALTYLAVTLPAFKGPHGYPFAALLMAEAAVACVVIARALPPPAAWVFCIGLFIYSAWQWEWHYARGFGAFHRQVAEAQWEILHKATAAIGDNAEDKQITLTGPGLHINYNIIVFEYLKKGRKPPTGIDRQLVGDIEQHRRAALGSDFVLAFSPEFTDLVPTLPTSSPEFRANLIKMIDATGSFESPLRMTGPGRGGDVLLYHQRSPGFAKFAKEENLAPISGPFPENNLPVVRWGFGDKTTLTAEGASQAKAVLTIQALALIGNQGMAVSVNGSQALDVDLSGNFEGFQIPLSYDQSGRAIIEIRYRRPSPNAVLFKGISIRALP